MSNHHHQPEDIAWDAFRYAAGEMSAAEAALFEERLASEQPAREALAAAVELAQASSLAMAGAKVTAAPATLTRPQKRSWSWKWGAVAAAVCIVVYAGLTALEFGNWNSPPETTAANQQELAARWSEVRELDDQSPAESLPNVEDLAITEDPTSIEDAETEDNLATAPDWMLAAVEGLRDATQMDGQQMMDDEQRVDPPLEQ